jgi:hypothetical protein
VRIAHSTELRSRTEPADTRPQVPGLGLRRPALAVAAQDGSERDILRRRARRASDRAGAITTIGPAARPLANAMRAVIGRTLRARYLELTDFVLAEVRPKYDAAGVPCSDAIMRNQDARGRGRHQAP